MNVGSCVDSDGADIHVQVDFIFLLQCTLCLKKPSGCFPIRLHTNTSYISSSRSTEVDGSSRQVCAFFFSLFPFNFRCEYWCQSNEAIATGPSTICSSHSEHFCGSHAWSPQSARRLSADMHVSVRATERACAWQHMLWSFAWIHVPVGLPCVKHVMWNCSAGGISTQSSKTLKHSHTQSKTRLDGMLAASHFSLMKNDDFCFAVSVDWPFVESRKYAAFCCGSHLILLIFSSISKLFR